MLTHYFRRDENDTNKISRNVFFTSSIIYIFMLLVFTVGWFMGLGTKDLSGLLISITTSFVTIASWHVKAVKDKEIEEIRIKGRTNAKF